MSIFSDEVIQYELLRKYAKNRWAALPPDVIPLTAADPDFQCAPEIRDALEKNARDGVFSYGAAWGDEDFRGVLSETIRKRKAISCVPEDILVTNGVAQAMWLVARYACEPGDEVILFNPVDFLFGKAVDDAGAKRVYSAVDKETGKFDIEGLNALINDRTRMICICNPHNPLGRVLTEAELRDITSVAVDNDLFIMSDEVWSDIVYDGRKHVSTASIGPHVADRTVSLYGFSKTFALAGLNVGFAVATNEEIMDGLKRTAPSFFFNVNNLSQEAGKAAYKEAWYWVEAFLEHLHGMRNYTYERLRSMEGVRCLKPEGTYVIFPDVSEFGMSSEEMTKYLLEKAKVAVVPGHGMEFSYFGPGGEGNIRIVYSTSKKIITEALNRIERALAKLRS
jgi:aspartate/methionine/tyrosine aminotransferase